MSSKQQTASSNGPDAAMIRLCRSNQWDAVLSHVQQNPALATTRMIMDNHIATTIIHQAINSKSDTKVREKVIMTILDMAPEAAGIRNGYGSLPLHVIAQRNTKMTSQTKERIIHRLIQAYPESLLEAGGVGQRTPLHIIFTDYTSPHLVKHMIEMAPRACFMRDKNGWLPIHVACSRHCSPEKLRLLLQANPASLYETTPEGETLLNLATTRATKSHPNYALIKELNSALDASAGPAPHVPVQHATYSPPVEHRDERVTRASRNNKRAKREEVPAEPDALASLLLHFHRNGNENETRQDQDDISIAEDTFEGEIAAV